MIHESSYEIDQQSSLWEKVYRAAQHDRERARKARETQNLKSEISKPMHAMKLDPTIVKAGRVPMKTKKGQACSLNGSWWSRSTKVGPESVAFRAAQVKVMILVGFN